MQWFLEESGRPGSLPHSFSISTLGQEQEGEGLLLAGSRAAPRPPLLSLKPFPQSAGARDGGEGGGPGFVLQVMREGWLFTLSRTFGASSLPQRGD